jgi:flagellar basal-body rod protein FlgG
MACPLLYYFGMKLCWFLRTTTTIDAGCRKKTNSLFENVRHRFHPVAGNRKLTVPWMRVSILLALATCSIGCQHPHAKSTSSLVADDAAPFFPDSTTELEYNAHRAFEMCIDVIAHNIANANTTGYKRCRVDFQDLAGQSVGQSESTCFQRMPRGRGAQVVSVRRIFSNGNTVLTGERLDVAIVGEGFFEVQLPDGTRAYTRDGSLRLASDGRFTTLNGMPLQGGFQPILRDASSIDISPNGNVFCNSSGGTQSFQVQLCRFSNPSGLEAIQGNLFKETTASGAFEAFNPGENSFATLMQGYLENSNVNISEEMYELARVRNACKALIEVAKARRF